ncbi:hypothetical protein ACS0TY_022178 [Phlomoides rotata]
MSCIVWNARGLGGRRALLNLQLLVLDNQPMFVFISETKVCNRIGCQWARNLNYSGCFCVDPKGRSGGLLLMWNDKVDIHLRSFSPGHIDCTVSFNGLNWRFTGFYGNPAQHLRHLSWELLNRLFNLKSCSDEPWLIGGDFNEIRFTSEKKGGSIRPLHQMKAFQEALDSIGMKEIVAPGPKFTWIKKFKGKVGILEKLDRFFANDLWNKLFPGAKAANLGLFGSDHRAVKVLFNFAVQRRRIESKRRFFFENKWMLESNYKEAVLEAWKVDSSVTKLLDRIKKCTDSLQKWAKENTGCILKRIKTVSNLLDSKLNDEALNEDDNEVRELEVELEKLYTQEEMHLHQRSRNNWLALGDRNTVFFHRAASGRKKRNLIRGIMNDQGAWLSNQEDIEAVF